MLFCGCRPPLWPLASRASKVTDLSSNNFGIEGPNLRFNSQISATRCTLSASEDRLSITALAIEHWAEPGSTIYLSSYVLIVRFKHDLGRAPVRRVTGPVATEWEEPCVR